MIKKDFSIYVACNKHPFEIDKNKVIFANRERIKKLILSSNHKKDTSRDFKERNQKSD